jgi:hypothetical protein
MPKPVKKTTKKRATPKRPSSDPILRARQMFDEHMAKAETSEMLAAPSFQEQLSAHMAKVGSKGGKVGGARRMQTMTPEQRSEVALLGLLGRVGQRPRRNASPRLPKSEFVPTATGLERLILIFKTFGASALAAAFLRRIGAIPTVITGRPDPEHISTSYVERQNWTVRTSMRRYTRLSNGFSRKIENHMAAVAINYFAYNFIKIHRTLRVSPAMAAGVTGRLFDVSDPVALLIEAESKKAA